MEPYRHIRRPPRCTCPDCTTDYARHNANKPAGCGCQTCTEFREAFSTAPATTSYDQMQEQQYVQKMYDVYGSAYMKPKERQDMGNINVCEREGCESIIKGNINGSIDMIPNHQENEPLFATLCPGCVADIVALLDTPPVTPRERVYTKGYKKVDESDVANISNEQLAAELFQRMMKDAQRQITGTVVDGTAD